MKWTEAVAAAARCVGYDVTLRALDEVRWRADQVEQWAGRQQRRLQAYGDRVGL